MAVVKVETELTNHSITQTWPPPSAKKNKMVAVVVLHTTSSDIHVIIGSFRHAGSLAHYIRIIIILFHSTPFFRDG
jgi:desulfoferrodoxin (superoxide reductase-like protein)